METTLPAVAHLALDGCTVELGDAAGERLEILLYTGAPVARGPYQMVFDLAGMEVPNAQVPLLFAHDPERPIGYAEPGGISTQGALRVSGKLLGNADANKVRNDAADGLQWQASMGVRLLDARFVDEDEQCVVNGRPFSNGYLISKSRLLEGSVLTLGADGNTRSKVLHMSAGDWGSVPVAAGKDKRMSDTEQGQAAPQVDVRGDLAAFLGHFPTDRKGWAAEQFAAGRDLTACLSEELKRKTDEVAAEASRLADAEARLATVAAAGYAGEVPSPAAEVESLEEIDLVAMGVDRHTALNDVVELVTPEWQRLNVADRREFSRKARGAGAQEWAALRKHEALGHVRVNWDAQKGF